jgi:hypothetical protein
LKDGKTRAAKMTPAAFMTPMLMICAMTVRRL